MSDNKQAIQATSEQDTRTVLPRVDVFEDESGITLLADLPGVPKDKLDIKVEGDTLWVEGTVQPRTPDGLEAVYAEVRVPRFRRSFSLSRELDSQRIDANLKDGVLTLRIPKAPHAQPRRITVQAT
ncbi:MAG TPA: Hsp20/alpha crystallin family protein [Albitalea sp.]|nr:Hsp20/alpha crystallin family protein [Albitalea sp.]